MKLLLDTHTFLWWDSQPNKLSSRVLELCADTQQELFLSVVSIWEMQIKHKLGKLTLRLPLDQLIAEQVQKNEVQTLSIQTKHVLSVYGLPNAHKDPFDRLLIAQANTEHMVLLSNDDVFKRYPVEIIW